MDFQEISILANQGVIFVGTSLGKTRSDWSEWQHKGTDNISKLKEWADSGYDLVAVATHGHQFMIDKDDPAVCKAMGMPEPFLTETYTDDTPSGGEHQYGLHDAVTESLGNLVVVYAEPGNPKSKKILELKLNGANSVAAPTTVRSGQPGKCDGVYKPRDQKRLAKGLNPEFVEWLRKYGTFVGAPKGKGAAGPARKFHPDFELDDHLEHNKAGEAFSYNKDGALHVVSNTCPLNDGTHRSGDEKQHIRDRVTEFIYGKNGWGFSCVVCNVFTKAEFEQKMLELDLEWEPYPYFVYEDGRLQLVHDHVLVTAFDGRQQNFQTVNQFFPECLFAFLFRVGEKPFDRGERTNCLFLTLDPLLPCQSLRCVGQIGTLALSGKTFSHLSDEYTETFLVLQHRYVVAFVGVDSAGNHRVEFGERHCRRDIGELWLKVS